MQSTAYDLNMYRPEEPKLREVKSSNKESNSKRSVRKAKGDLLCMGAVLLVLIGGMLFSRVQVNEACADLNAAKTTLSEVTAENDSLGRELDTKLSEANVEAYVTQNLGMIKLDTSQVQYVSLEKDNLIEVKESEGIMSRIVNAAAEIKAYLGF